MAGIEERFKLLSNAAVGHVHLPPLVAERLRLE